MKKSFSKISLLAVAASMALILVVSGQYAPAGAAARQATPAATNPFLSMGDLNKQLDLLKLTPEGDAKTPWLQVLKPSDYAEVDTTAMKKAPPWHICFSNASLTNNWRVSGFGVMQAVADQMKKDGKISEFTVTDAQGKDEKQISDIDDLLTKKCDALIISPNTTEALTPEVEKAAKSGIPVVVFDRGVNTTAYTSFVHPIGGYAFGYAAAKFITDSLKGKGNVLSLRILPGVDVLENRWAAAQQVFQANPDIKVVGVEFDDNDVAKTKSIVTDYLGRGQIDAVWMDAGEAAPGVYEAFVDAGQKVPPITAEDNNGWLKIWTKNNLNSFSSTYPSFQWRTALLDATMILSGQKVPKEWILPQPSITNDTVKQYVQPDLPDTYYVLSSGDSIPGYLDSLKTK